ncbi:26S protease regulatory subunit 6B like [Apostasia shenzhenica]|uniref:26S protease regulatory subunit 6B like n=1 Tax=Apostasia shenzhenica TaxID=1088818 RepID=A0A2I0A4Z2_9ASPA|nr:26S protease regulatory subunit 6B like [Apostasia shenzhenica]
MRRAAAMLLRFARSAANGAGRSSSFPSLSHQPLLLLIEQQRCPQYSSGTTSSSGASSFFSSLLPMIFAAGAVGLGRVEASSTNAGEEGYQHWANGMEKLAPLERQRLEELLNSRGMQRGSYPPFTVDVKGPKVYSADLGFTFSIDMIEWKRVPPMCEVSRLIVDLVLHLGLKAEQRGGGSEMILHAWDSAAAWQLTLTFPEKINKSDGEQIHMETDSHEDDFCVLIFEPLLGSEYCEIEFIKKGSFTLKELDALTSVLKLAGKRDVKKQVGRKPGGYKFKGDGNYNSRNLPSVERSVSALEAMGVRVYGLDEAFSVDIYSNVLWDNIAGYHQQKREIEDTILLALQSPEVYDEIARGTRLKFESNRPRAILFEGPPVYTQVRAGWLAPFLERIAVAKNHGKGKGVPLLYVPLEVIMSKYYGESERLLGNVFSLANELTDGAIIFLDEVDSFAVARDSEMHEATRRILSVLLRQIDGFEQEKRVVVIAATNRKQDLDPALLR